MPAEIPIDIELIKDLYYNQHKSKTEICYLLNFSPKTLWRYLNKYGIRLKDARGHKFKDLTGKRFGRLTVLKFTKMNQHGRTCWLCLCDCGIEKEVWGECLGKYTKSCGCYRDEIAFKGCGDISITFYKTTRRGAIERGLEFSITIEDIWELYLKQNRKCALSGQELRFIKGYTNKHRRNIQNASVDRTNNNLGYTKENIQIVHKDINKMKQHFDNDYFIQTCKLICNNNRS